MPYCASFIMLGDACTPDQFQNLYLYGSHPVCPSEDPPLPRTNAFRPVHKEPLLLSNRDRPSSKNIQSSEQHFSAHAPGERVPPRMRSVYGCAPSKWDCPHVTGCKITAVSPTAMFLPGRDRDRCFTFEPARP